MNASSYLNKIEIHFWNIATPLMLQSKVVRFGVRSLYYVVEGKTWPWLIRMTAVFSVLTFIFGYLLGSLFW